MSVRTTARDVVGITDNNMINNVGEWLLFLCARD